MILPYNMHCESNNRMSQKFLKEEQIPMCFQSKTVRPDMRYCSRSRCFHPDSGTKHISVPPRHMTKSCAPDFQHDITTLQIQGYNISYNRHKTASNEIQQRKIHVWLQTTSKCLVAKRKTSIP